MSLELEASKFFSLRIFAYFSQYKMPKRTFLYTRRKAQELHCRMLPVIPVVATGPVVGISYNL